MNLDVYIKRGIRYVIAYSPGKYSVVDTRDNVTISTHKSKRDAKAAIKRYKYVDGLRLS